MYFRQSDRGLLRATAMCAIAVARKRPRNGVERIPKWESAQKVVTDHFYIALFSAFEQTHCTGSAGCVPVWPSGKALGW